MHYQSFSSFLPIKQKYSRNSKVLKESPLVSYQKESIKLSLKNIISHHKSCYTEIPPSTNNKRPSISLPKDKIKETKKDKDNNHVESLAVGK